MPVSGVKPPNRRAGATVTLSRSFESNTELMVAELTARSGMTGGYEILRDNAGMHMVCAVSDILHINGGVVMVKVPQN